MRRHHMPLSLSVFIALVILTSLSLPSSAEIPQIISYQGKVTDTGGTPVADGNYTMRFRIYNAASGGTLRWDSSNRTIAVSGGVFNVLLGESPQLAIDLEFDEGYWLLVTVEGDDQTPRQRLGSVGYAYMASGLVPGTEVSGSVNSGTLAAIKGVNTSTTGFTYGGRFESVSSLGRGVYGEANATTGYTYGGWFESASTSGKGVYGDAFAHTGTAIGVYGQSASESGTGVQGVATRSYGTTYGVYGQSASTSGYGVYGLVEATTGTTYGVAGQSNSTNGRAVYGHAIAGTGECFGGRFENGSSSGRGVFGHAYSATGTTYGVYGKSNSAAGYGIYYSGGLAGTGTKACVVKTSQGPTLMYCQESPENWFEDFGEGRLVDGKAHIELDHLFLETVTIDAANPMHVFIEPHGPCKWTYVVRISTSFDVVEQDGGTSTVGFSYRVVAKRKGFEQKRLDYCKAAETDSYLYPELREKELRELEDEKAGMEE